MSNHEIVETSDDEERELNWFGLPLADYQSPRKRLKLYHSFDSVDIPQQTSPRSPSVPSWPPTSSSPRLVEHSSSPSPNASIQANGVESLLKDHATIEGDAIDEEESANTLPILLSSPLRGSESDKGPPSPRIGRGPSTPSTHASPLPFLSHSSPDPLSLFDASPPHTEAAMLFPVYTQRTLRTPPLPSATSSSSLGNPVLSPDIPNPLIASVETTPHRTLQSLGDIFYSETIAHHPDTLPRSLPASSHDKGHSHSPMSPSTPHRGHTLTSPSHFPPDESPRTIKGARPVSNEQYGEDVVPVDTNFNIPDISRYPLRQRKAAQLNPYKYDFLRYKHALSGNPDAIVKLRELREFSRLNNDHYNPDDQPEDSQALWEPEENHDSSDDERQGRENAHSRDGQHLTTSIPYASEERQYSELLPDLPSSDIEESKSFQDLANEAKRVEKDRRKAERENKRQEKLAMEESRREKAHAKARRFPIGRGRSTSQPHSGHISSNDDAPLSQRSTTVLYSHGTLSPPVMAIARIPSSPSLTQSGSSPAPMDLTDTLSHRSAHDSDTESVVRHSSDVEEEDNSWEEKLPKGVKILRRMYPTSMLKTIATGSLGRSRPKSNNKHVHSGSENEETSVLPGQSRTAWSSHTWDREVKGDSESSDDDQRSSVHDFVLDDYSAGPSSPRERIEYDTHHDVFSKEADDESDDEGVDDFDIEAYLAGAIVPKKERASSGRIREESLIDWMLSRTRIVGGPRRPKAKKRPPDRARNTNQTMLSSKYEIDITTHGVRRERQTKLNFEGHTKKKSAGPRARARHDGPSHRRDRPNHRDVESDSGDDDVQIAQDTDAPPQKKSHMQKERERRARGKSNGQYVFTSDNAQVISGRRKGAMPTINILDDIEFLQAIAPLSQDAPQPLQPARIVNIDPKGAPLKSNPSSRSPANVEGIQISRRSFSDSDIDVLQSGLSFRADSYIRKGWLHELIGVICLDAPPLPPIIVNFDGVELGPDASVDTFSKGLKQVFNTLFDVITSLLGIEDIEKEREWLRIQRAFARLLSWQLSTATEADRIILSGTVQEQVSAFVSRMHAQSLSPSSLDTFTLSVCWFAIELSARLDLASKSPDSNTSLTQSVLLLMNYLWQYGLDPIMDPIRGNSFPSGTPLTEYATELWVSLFHLLDCRKNIDQKSSHPFSTFLQETLEKVLRPSSNPLERSERLWHSIFSLCALSQFSVHGMTTSQPRLPASWNLIVHALQQIRLDANPATDQGLPQYIIDKRDECAQAIIQRCFLLWKRWNWKLDEVSTVFDRLLKIFQSRHFGGLRHETTPNYPGFLIHHDWAGLDKHEKGDTAFVLFLKLLFQSVGCDVGDHQRTLPPRARKWLSMAVAVTKLPFSKTTPLTDLRDLAMLFNRLSAVALGIHLDPNSHVQRMKLARSYVDFAEADETTRSAVIRGMTYLAILLKNAGKPMDAIIIWVEDMATAMANDRKSLEDVQRTVQGVKKSPLDSKTLLARLHICVQMLINAVRQIFEVHFEDSTYPEPRLLKALDPIFKVTALVDEPTTTDRIQELLTVFIDARRKVLPPPKRPYPPSTEMESQESQDDYPTMLIDYDDPDLLAALDANGNVPAGLPNEIAGKEEALSSYMNAPLCSWAWRNLNKKVMDHASPSKDDFLLFDRWLKCWIGCADVAVHAGTNGKITWKRFLNLKENWNKLSANIQSWLDVETMKWILKFDPMTYLEHKKLCIENLLAALVSTDPTDKRDFICLVLEIDQGHNPLLVGVSMDMYDTATDALSAEQASTVLQSIINNIACGVRDHVTFEGDDLIQWCIKIYQLMARNVKELVPNSSERTKYVSWCSAVAQAVQGHRELYNEPRLAVTWIGWARELK